MQVLVCVGGNKQISGARLGVNVARRLQAAGKDVSLFAVKGAVKAAGPVVLKEYAASATVKTLAASLIKAKADVVVSIMNLRACEAALQANIPFIYVEYDGFKEDKPVKTKKALLKKAKKVLVLCDGDKPLSKRTYTGLSVLRVTTPAMGVEHGSWGRPKAFKKQNNIVAMGPLTKESGFDKLLACWTKLAPLHPSWHLTIVGDGALKSTLNRTIAKNHLQDRVEIVSAAEGVEPFLAQADIFAYAAQNPARADVLLDAMASKLPSIAFDSPAVRTWVEDTSNGVLVEDEASFVHSLDALMVDWGYRVGLAVAAGKHNERYSFDELIRLVWENF